jgi:hypothetical protein
MEAILALHVWSLHADRPMERKEGAVKTRGSSAALIPKHRLISSNGGSDGGLSRADEMLWIGQNKQAAIRDGNLSPQRATQDKSAEYPVITGSSWDLFRVKGAGE